MDNHEEKIEDSEKKGSDCGCEGSKEKKSSSCKGKCSCNSNTIDKAHSKLADLIRLDTL